MAHAARTWPIRAASAATVLLLATVALAGPLAPRAQALPSLPNPCQLPVVGNVCDAVSSAVTKVAQEAGDFVMRGVTAWVTNAAVWVTGKVGELINATASPDLTASWFQGQYGTMVGVAGALALLMLMLAVIQSVIHQDAGLLMRSAFGYLPMAFILAGAAIVGTDLLVSITDDLSAMVNDGLGERSRPAADRVVNDRDTGHEQRSWIHGTTTSISASTCGVSFSPSSGSK